MEEKSLLNDLGDMEEGSSLEIDLSFLVGKKLEKDLKLWC